MITMVYKQHSTLSNDIVVRFDGKQLFKSYSSKAEDVIFTLHEGGIYKGNSIDESEMMYRFDKKHLYQPHCDKEIVYSFEGNFIFKGNSFETEDVIYTFDGKYFYEGEYALRDKVLFNVNGIFPVFLFLLFIEGV